MPLDSMKSCFMLHAVSWMLTACIDRSTVCDLPQIRGDLVEVNAYILNPILYLRKKCLIKFILLQETYEGWNFNSGNYLFTTDTK